MLRQGMRWKQWGMGFACWSVLGWAGLWAVTGSPKTALGAAVDDQEPIQFNRDVRPILSDKCFACHGFDPNHRQADLRLDQPPEADGQSWVIVPGQPEASVFWERVIAEEEDLRMPPPSTHKQLSSGEKETLRRWIEQGAVFEGHWAFQPLRRDMAVPSVPGVDQPIDAFIRHRLSALGMEPAPPAEKETLIRRLSFALTGLPPTPEQVAQYRQDTAPDAYERLVQRFLDAPEYGEEMARHWLDLARYADTHGMHLDNERQMWAYRDWVIRSFNQNQPFDAFTIEQLAGDLLPDPSLDQLIATGFNRCNVTTGEGGSIDAEFLFRYAVERTSTTAEVWLGLTAGCAVCHDHKFDPISQAEFYSLYAFFYSAADPAMDGNALLTQPAVRLEAESDRQHLAELDGRMAQLRERMREVAQQLDYADPAQQSPEPGPQLVQEWWMDDDFLATGRVQASPGQATEFVTATATGQLPWQGEKMLKRQDTGLAQDVWETASQPLRLPAQAKLVAHVYLESDDLPRAIMIQFNHGGWKHRAVWGDYDVIDWGQANTTERVGMGDLPQAGQWVRLEIPSELVGLKSGDAITGFALTQFGGTVYWDQVGVEAEVNPATDPTLSFAAWWRDVAAQDQAGLPVELRETAAAGPSGTAAPHLIRDLRIHYLINHCGAVAEAFSAQKQELAALEQQRRDYEAGLPSTFIFRDLPQPRPAHVMMRGQYDQPAQEVFPDVPSVLPPLLRDQESSRANRLDLARWLVSRDHPLTARVAVNRYWQQFFGVGLVQSSADFGSQGEPPTHPELLDWLAAEFQDSGWDVKALVRQIVSSETFKQSSQVTAEAYERDPTNRWLARMSRPRLDAEQIRDNALLVSGLLQPVKGGAGVKPYQPPNIWEPVGFAGSNTRFYTRDSGSALYRRSIYTFLKRTAPPPFMSNFDAPNREQTCSRRQQNNTPLQALQLMNDVQHVEAARALASRVMQDGPTELTSRLKMAVEIVLARQATNDEIRILTDQYQRHWQSYQSDKDQAVALVSVGESKVPADWDPVELAAFTLICNTLLNLDETLTRN